MPAVIVRAGLLALVGFGEESEGIVRVALLENKQRPHQAAKGVKEMLGRA